MQNTIINLKEIEKIIPSKNYKQPQEELKTENTEWCMTKYRIENKTYITISICYPNNGKLIFINPNGEQSIDEVPEDYNKFIIERIYWYGTEK